MGPTPAASRPPGVDDVVRIAGMTDPVIRNLQITDSYHHIAVAMRDQAGDGANWCTISTWASKQAGQSIRGEDLLEALRSRLKAGPEILHPVRSAWRALLRRGLFHPDTRLGRLVSSIHSPFDAFERTSDAIARGNLKVFEEIGLHFSRYLKSVPEAVETDAAEFQAFLAELKPGDPPEGQEYLKRAFTHYQQQRLESDAKVRAQLMLLANIEVSVHEQTRLQPEIQEALDAPVTTADNLGQRAGFSKYVSGGLRRFAIAVTRSAITECLMTLSLPGHLLKLSDHLDIPYPEFLRSLDQAELVELLQGFEPAPTNHDDAGASDWSDLRQRIHYVIHLFRAFHEDGELFSPPFTPEQVRLFRQGTVPGGNL